MSLQQLDFNTLGSILKASILSWVRTRLQFVKVCDSEPKFDTYTDSPKIMWFSQKIDLEDVVFWWFNIFGMGQADNPRWKFMEEFYQRKQGIEQF